MVKKVFLFPFKVLWFFIRALLFPWYLRTLFRLPWWTYGALAVFLAFLAVEENMGASARQHAFEIAMATAPQATTPVMRFDGGQHATTAGEVLISGRYEPSNPIRTWKASGPDFAYVPLLDDGGETVGAVLIVLKFQADHLEGWLESQSMAAGDSRSVIVGGMIEVNMHRDKILAELHGEGLAISADAPLIEPFIYGRVSGLEKTARTSPTLAVAFSALAVIFGCFTLFRLRRVRGQKADEAASELEPNLRVPMPRVPRQETIVDTHSVTTVPRVSRNKPEKLTASFDEISPVVPAVAQAPQAAVRRPFRLRSAEEIVDEVFGPNAGRDTPRRKF